MEQIKETIQTVMQRYWNKEITQEELQSQYSGQFTSAHLVSALEAAFDKQDSDSLESIFHIGSTFNLFTTETVPVLCKYLTEVWHRQHEEIARLLQPLKDPRAVQALADGMHIHCDYWHDDGDAFIRKCAYALAAIDTQEAKDKLVLLAKDANAIVKKYALHQLAK